VFVTYNESPKPAVHFTPEFIIPNKTKGRDVFEILVEARRISNGLMSCLTTAES